MKYCPKCGKENLINVSHEEQMSITSELIFCKDCEIGFVIQTGEDVYEWLGNCADDNETLAEILNRGDDEE